MTPSKKEVTEFAVKLQLIKGMDGEFRAVMREHFPGITNYAVREAYKNARIIIAIDHTTRTSHE